VRVERWFGSALHTAVDGAAAALVDPDCAGLLGAFRDLQGRPLRDRLPGADAATYVRRVYFYDGSDDPLCRLRETYAFTSPGSHVVRACPAFGWLAIRDKAQAQAIVIHEMLHTLGLGENPPSSSKITHAVETRCVATP
jgi:hypothetical protein